MSLEIRIKVWRNLNWILLKKLYAKSTTYLKDNNVWLTMWRWAWKTGCRTSSRAHYHLHLPTHTHAHARTTSFTASLKPSPGAPDMFTLTWLKLRRSRDDRHVEAPVHLESRELHRVRVLLDFLLQELLDPALPGTARGRGGVSAQRRAAAAALPRRQRAELQPSLLPHLQLWVPASELPHSVLSVKRVASGDCSWH